MKTNLVRLPILAAALLPWAVSADFSIGWWTVDGGGSVSTNGTFAIVGTVGQPDAGRAGGGQYLVNGGFWGVVTAVPTPGAPTLTVQYTTTNTVTVSWPSPSPGFSLQANQDIHTSNWVPALEAVADNGTVKFIIANPPTGNRFYRLVHP